MSVKNSQQLKQLESRKSEAEQERKEVHRKQRVLIKQGTQLDHKITDIVKQIERLKAKEVVITEHAILRYVERAMGLDVEQIKDKILTEATRKAIEAMGNGKYPIDEGLKAIVKDNTIITVA